MRGQDLQAPMSHLRFWSQYLSLGAGGRGSRQHTTEGYAGVGCLAIVCSEASAGACMQEYT